MPTASARPFRLLVLTLIGAGLCLVGSTSSPAHAESSSFGYVTRSWIGASPAEVWTTDSAAITVSRTVDGVTVEIRPGDPLDDENLYFAAPHGGALTPGVYDDAERMPGWDSDRPRLDPSPDCASPDRGSFEVLENSGSRFWAVYRLHCGGDGVFGEVRIGYPSAQGLQVLQTRLRWLEQYPEVSAGTSTINVVNRTDVSQTLSASFPVGGSDFSLADNTCVDVAPGASCLLAISDTPSRPGESDGVLEIRDSVGNVVGSVTLLGEGIRGLSYWQRDDQPRITPQDGASIGAGVLPATGGLRFTVQAPWPDNVSADFGNTYGFEDETTYQSDDSCWASSRTSAACMDVSTDSGCGSYPHGTFTVHDIVFNARHELTSGRVDFTQYCYTSTVPLRGTVAFRVPDPNAPLDDNTPPSPVQVQSAAWVGEGSGQVSWLNPADQDFVETIVRGADGAIPPATPYQGDDLGLGRQGSVEFGGVSAGSAYSVSIFTRDTSGNLSPARHVTFSSSQLSLQAPGSGIAGQAIALSGQLTGVSTATDLALEGPDGGVTTVSTDDTGAFTAEVSSKTAGSNCWKVSYAGDETHTPASSSACVDLTTAATVLTVQGPSVAVAGQPMTLSGTLDGVGEAAPLTVTGSDGTSADVTTNAGGTYAVTVRPALPGSTTWTVKYAGDDTHDPAQASTTVDVSPIVPGLTLRTDRTTYTTNKVATIFVNIGKSESRHVTLTATRSERAPIVIFDGKVPVGGLALTRKMAFTEIFTASAPADATHAAVSTSLRRGVRLVMYTYKTRPGDYSVSGKWAIYDRATTPVFQTAAWPKWPGRCLRNVVQRYLDGAWTTIKRTACIPINQWGWIHWRYRGFHPVGVGLRVNGVFAGDDRNLRTVGPWTYFKFR